MGHELGDRLIIALSLSIQHAVRNSDVAARIGGDEFVIFFPDLDKENSRMVLERIKEEFTKRSLEVLGWISHFSWGLSQWIPEKDTAESFIARADKAMYKMKMHMRRGLS
jgi:diguanylate cyclase (GGDEF)-like protein